MKYFFLQKWPTPRLMTAAFTVAVGMLPLTSSCNTVVDEGMVDSFRGDPEADSPSGGGDAPQGECIICRIQHGEFAQNTRVTFEAIVTALKYTLNDSYDPIGISGMYVAEPGPHALPYGGIYVSFTAAEPLEAFAEADLLALEGMYTEYYGRSQIDGPSVIRLGRAALPQPVFIEDPSTIATTFVQEGDEWVPTDNHGITSRMYEGVLVEVRDVSITVRNLGHGMFEVTGGLAIDKELHYYSGERREGRRFSSIVGILIYSYDAFKLAPRREDDVTPAE